MSLSRKHTRVHCRQHGIQHLYTYNKTILKKAILPKSTCNSILRLLLAFYNEIPRNENGTFGTMFTLSCIGMDVLSSLSGRRVTY